MRRYEIPDSFGKWPHLVGLHFKSRTPVDTAVDVNFHYLDNVTGNEFRIGLMHIR